MSKFVCSHGMHYPVACVHCVDHVLAHNREAVEAMRDIDAPAALRASFDEMLAALEDVISLEGADVLRFSGVIDRARAARTEK